jgi:type IV pilus assembly protein PilB
METELIPKILALKYAIAPRYAVVDGKASIRSVEMLSEAAISDLELITSSYIENRIISFDEYQKEFEEVYSDGRQDDSAGMRFKVLMKNSEATQANGEVESAPVVKLIDGIISRAIEIGASDIHLESGEATFRLRYRLDGVLQEQPPLPFEKKGAIISRIKIMADLDIAERRRPQDGRLRVEGIGKSVDIRVSIIPTDFGEKVALRILDKSQLKLEVENLGMEPDQLNIFKEALEKPNGIILVTGPTGSGKTTTLYAALNYIRSPRLNILTIEDPIEYNLDGINQSQVKREIGYDFASALRTFLRQDPDVILVGEIRDLETAEIAIRASLTGHLVLSTLHTNDAPSAVTRLVDIGIEPYLVASSVRLIIAQRLVRLLCAHCKTENNSPDVITEIQKSDNLKIERAFEPRGCPKCLKTGYIGRSAVFELLPITDGLEEPINNKFSTGRLREIALSQGMAPVRTAGLGKVQRGLTSLEEILRIC